MRAENQLAKVVCRANGLSQRGAYQSGHGLAKFLSGSYNRTTVTSLHCVNQPRLVRFDSLPIAIRNTFGAPEQHRRMVTYRYPTRQ